MLVDDEFLALFSEPERQLAARMSPRCTATCRCRGNRFIASVTASSAPAWFAAAFCLNCLFGCSDDRRAVGIATNTAQSIQTWSVVLQPILEIGVDDRLPGHDLSQVVGVALPRDGSVLIGDAASQEIRQFRENGELVRRVGRRGEGPGDLANLSGIDACTDGRIVARQPRRVTVFESDGALQRVVAAPDERAVPPQDAAGVDANCENFVWLTRSPLPFDEQGVVRQPWTLFRTSENGTVELLSFIGLERFRTEVDGQPAMAAIPWQPQPSWAVFDSMIVWTSGASDSLRVWHQDTGWRDMSAPVLTREVRESDRVAYRNNRTNRIAENPPEARSLLPLERLPELPSRAPAVSQLLADGSSCVWMRPYPDSSFGFHTASAPGDPNGERWLVLDVASGDLAEVYVPPHVRLLAISGDRIAGVKVVEDGTEHVLVYRLERR